jgi:hypothetical protein
MRALFAVETRTDMENVLAKYISFLAGGFHAQRICSGIEFSA